jgi:hypothetical protein
MECGALENSAHLVQIECNPAAALFLLTGRAMDTASDEAPPGVNLPPQGFLLIFPEARGKDGVLCTKLILFYFALPVKAS